METYLGTSPPKNWGCRNANDRGISLVCLFGNLPNLACWNTSQQAILFGRIGETPMPAKQQPLPGFEDLTYADKPSSMFLLYAAHCALRDEIAHMFNTETIVLRELGKANDSQCPPDVYASQRAICMGLKALCSDIDDMNERIEAMFHAK